MNEQITFWIILLVLTGIVTLRIRKRLGLPATPPRVIILGGGFAGAHTLLGLKKYCKRGRISVTLVNRNDYFLFTPLLHEVISNKVQSAHVGISLPELLKKCHAKFIKAEIATVDLISKKVITNISVIQYDILVVALGASVNFFGIPGATSIPALKTLTDAEIIKQQVRDTLSSDQPQQNIIIIGGGATGVEIAAEISDLKKNDSRTTITLIEAMNDILPHTHPALKQMAKRSLHKRGVTIMLNAAVREIRNQSIILHDGREIPFDNAVWTAGVKATELSFSPSPQLDKKSGRITITPTLHLATYPTVFVIGDMADGYPMTAQVAVAQARHTARNIKTIIAGQTLFPFNYHPSGMLFSLGRWMAGAEIKTHLIQKVLYFWGIGAWWLWHVVYLAKIPGIKNKMRIAHDWLKSLNK